MTEQLLDRLDELDTWYERIIDKTADAFIPSHQKLETARRNAQAGRRRRKRLKPLPTVRDDARKEAERVLFELAERRGGPELERFVSLSNERDELRGTINTLILSTFDPSANEEMVEMAKHNGGYIPKLCGPQEVAELLGVSRQRVYQLRADRPDFPAPLQTLRSGPIWDERDIKAWKKETGR